MVSPAVDGIYLSILPETNNISNGQFVISEPGDQGRIWFFCRQALECPPCAAYLGYPRGLLFGAARQQLFCVFS